MTALLPRIEIESAPQPTAAVIWLHGLGADGNDFAALVPELDLRNCPPIHFVFPHAPEMPVTVNAGYVMPAWYDILGADLVQRQDAAGIHRDLRRRIDRILFFPAFAAFDSPVVYCRFRIDRPDGDEQHNPPDDCG